jgi:two-component system, NtrC family, response regulator AtoC
MDLLKRGHSLKEGRKMEADFRQGSESSLTGMEFVESVSPSMRSVEAVMLEVAQSEVPVLLLAEDGAGKKATACRIHELSRRRGQCFRLFSCSDFEHVVGGDVFLGEGTVFLAELAELNAQGQAGLLHWLTGADLAGGKTNGRGTPRVARLICGSARDLEAEVKKGNLREDLYYRISGVCLRLPPLRQRREDIPILMGHFLQKFGRDFQHTVPALSAATLRLFEEYSWPGNVQELENAAKAIVALGDETVAMGGLRAMLRRTDAADNGVRVSLKQASRAASREMEKELILRALTRTRWNRRRAAQDLQISYKALLYKLKQMGCSEYRAT